MQNKTYPSADKGDGEPFPDKPPRRLSPAELSSLFRRLDVNGDGELSIAEFRKIVEKLDLLKLHQQTNATTSEATLKKVVDDAVFEAFVASDTDKTSRGSLNLLEFRSAYNALYNKISHFRISKKSAESKSIVRATRYGSFMQDGERKFVFETYIGSTTAISLKLTYDVSSINSDGQELRIQDMEPQRSLLTNMTLSHINTLMIVDEARNKSVNGSIMWWVDVCVDKWRSSEAESFCECVGIPTDVVDSMFLLEDSAPRLTYGHCDNSTGYAAGKTTALSMIVQCLCLKNLPIVKRDPVWLSNLGAVGRYVSSKTAMFRPFMYSEKCHQRIMLSGISEREVEVIREKVIHYDNRNFEKRCDYLSEDYNPHKFEFRIPQFKNENSFHRPKYLLSSADITKRPVSVDRETYSLHIVNHGSHPIALYTYRVCNTDLPEQGFTFEQHTRAGVLGRITMGVWKKLLQVTRQHGVSNICGELDDTPFALAQLLITLIHSVSMTCVQSLDEWAKLLRCSIEEVAVTKHSKHIELLKTITLEIFEYVKLFNRDFEPIAGQLKDPSPSQAFAASEGLVDRRESLAKQRKPSLMTDYSILAEVHVLDGLDVAQHFQGIKSKSTLEMLFSNKLEARQKLKDVEKFTSRKEARSIDLLPNLIDGMDSLDKKGTVTWQSNLEKILEVCDGLQERYQMCLDEKRNFWSFVLGIVSIATFPFAVMTGYFGMNFHNMNDPGHILTSDYWPGFPGSDVIWVLSIIIYGSMLLWALHFEVFYSAS